MSYKKGFILTVDENQEKRLTPMQEITDSYFREYRPYDEFSGIIYIFEDIDYLSGPNLSLGEPIEKEKGNVCYPEKPLGNALKLLQENLPSGEYIFMVEYHKGGRCPGTVEIELYPVTPENLKELGVAKYTGPKIMPSINKNVLIETTAHNLYQNYIVSYGITRDGFGGTLYPEEIAQGRVFKEIDIPTLTELGEQSEILRKIYNIERKENMTWGDIKNAINKNIKTFSPSQDIQEIAK